MASALAGLVARVRDRIRTQADRQDFLNGAADMGAGNLEIVRRAEDYYDGMHRVQLTEREREYLQASGLPYAENFCETIVDTFASRMVVIGFGSDDESYAKFAKDLATANRMDARQILIHEGAAKLGNYFAIVEAEDGRLPCIYPNRPDKVKVVYDSGEPVYAVKVWNTGRASVDNPNGRTIRRMNIYWPDRIEKWWTAASDNRLWQAFRDSEESDGTAPWTMDGTPEGEPIGIPVVHFANKPNPHYGRPEHQGSIPQQDALNKSLIDHFWIMDAQGWPQQWGSGVSASDIKRHPGSLWTTEKQEARFGQLDPADPKASIEAIESQIRRMASRSQTPLHLMLAGGNLPSGETLKTSESGLSRKVKRRQTEWGNCWEDVVRIAARIETAFGSTEPKLDASLDTRWERAESRQETVEAEAAAIYQSLGVSRDTLLSSLGFDPAEERRKNERDGAPAATAAADLLKKAEEMRARVADDSGVPNAREQTQPPGN